MTIAHCKRMPKWQVPPYARAWVFDQGSLTKRLIEASQGEFKVRVTYQGWAVASCEERRVLKIKERQKALVREVELLCFGEVWVIARSIIPATTLSGKERQLKSLGTKPLGAFLFKSRHMSRSRLECVSSQMSPKQRIYGRRSVFYLHHKPLLVSELFLPSVFNPKLMRVNDDR